MPEEQPQPSLTNDTTQISEADADDQFKTRVQKEYQKQNIEGWQDGTISNIHLDPEFTFFGLVIKPTSNPKVNSKNHSINELQSNGSERSITLTDSSQEDWSTLVDVSKLNAIVHSNIDDYYTLTRLNSPTDFSKLNPQDPSDYYLLPVSTLGISIEATDAYLIGSISYSVTAELSSDELLEPVHIKYSDQITETSDIGGQVFSIDSPKKDIQFRLNEGEIVELRETKTWSKRLKKYGLLLLTGIIAQAIMYPLTLFGIFGETAFIETLFTNKFWVTTIPAILLMSDFAFEFIQFESRFVSETNKEPKGIKYEKSETEEGDMEEAPDKEDTNSTVHAVTVSPTDDDRVTVSSSPQPVPTDLVWDLQSEGKNTLSDAAVDLFVEYGFERDFDEIELNVTRDEQLIPENAPRIADTTNTWYLFVN